MPASVSHSYFANDVYDILSDDIKQRLLLPSTKMFAQSTDALLFYRLFSLRPGKQIRSLQKTFHKSKTQEFFLSVISYMKEHQLQEDKDTCSFLVGFITHYVLDMIVHPFVFYKTGCFKKNVPSSYKYNGLHTFMETYIDNYLIKKRENINPYTFSVSKFCFDIKKFSLPLTQTIDQAFSSVYQVPNMGGIYYQSLKDMKFSIRAFREDRYGIKRAIYKILDTFMPKNVLRFESISYHYPMNDHHDFLNFKHELWRNPTTYSITSRDSFYDLYIKALKTAKKIIEDTFSYLNGNDIDLTKVFTNCSYITGLDCNLKKELKYFLF